jgi:hypothetical protein
VVGYGLEYGGHLGKNARETAEIIWGPTLGPASQISPVFGNSAYVILFWFGYAVAVALDDTPQCAIAELDSRPHCRQGKIVCLDSVNILNKSLGE